MDGELKFHLDANARVFRLQLIRDALEGEAEREAGGYLCAVPDQLLVGHVQGCGRDFGGCGDGVASVARRGRVPLGRTVRRLRGSLRACPQRCEDFGWPASAALRVHVFEIPHIEVVVYRIRRGLHEGEDADVAGRAELVAGHLGEAVDCREIGDDLCKTCQNAEETLRSLAGQPCLP